MGEETKFELGGRPRSRRFWIILLSTIIGVPVFVILILLIVVLIQAAVITAPQGNIGILNDAKTEGITDDKLLERAERFAGALRIETVSYSANNQNLSEFPVFHQYLLDGFPNIHNRDFIERYVVNEYSLLYKVTGSTPGKLPYLLAAHMDVVPAPPANWKHPPFGGVIEDGEIWGRGAVDDKGGVMGIMEALEYWLSQGVQPKRTFFIAFGHDEEIGGNNGAHNIAIQLRELGVEKLDFVFDEGLISMTDNILPGVTKPAALIAVSEKGFLYLKLEVTGTLQHSSFPPAETPIGILGRAVGKLEEHQQPSVLGTGPESDAFHYVAPDTDYGTRILYANMWLFGPLMAAMMQNDRLLGPLMKTTTGLTIFNSGVKDNVIPDIATAVINHRVHPGQTSEQVIEHDRWAIGDNKVKITVTGQMDPHPVSPFGPDALAYQLISTSIYQTFDEVVVAPCIMIANTDTTHYLPFTEKVYRFIPTLVTPDDVSRYHGDNERVTIKDYERMVNFYFRFMQNADLVFDLAPDDTQPADEL
ncbi:N-fatty-acyl-amino acid synthase/hydrolase PM20D1-like [Neocloeon triangulifer]|uniref:N-fatty-acyl-amino acid synthase/hydrolase PM20D1-like n=1 Tax=Neocloeon triangulifer TaxID=2078957 RepID=UPI00286F4B30|nr:N-fatty-acyl-amino acid synthase/hydrolase PM20D1-like [Neocloeon triangulifer]